MSRKPSGSGGNAWIRSKLDAGLSFAEIKAMHQVFLKETGLSMTYDTYNRLVRRLRTGAAKTGKANVSSTKPHIITEASGPNKSIVATSSKIRTLEELLAYCCVDLSTWRVTGHRVNSWGSEENENFQVRAELRLIEDDEEDPTPLYHALIEEAKKYAPKYPEFTYPEIDPGQGCMYEISLFDHHWGQLSWAPETGGQNYDSHIARKVGLAAIRELINRARGVAIAKILLIVGNDFYNVDTVANTTTKGTPQAEDGRWKKTFPAGVQFWIDAIEMCTRIAPVGVVVIPGNHDAQRAFFLGVALDCWFHNHPHVEIDNRPKDRKYIEFGLNMLGLTHGDQEVTAAIPQLMPTEEPAMWARTKYREMHLAHLHKKAMKAHQLIDEVQGIRVYRLPSLVPLNAWSAGSGYTAMRETTGHLWHPTHGKLAIYYYHPEEDDE